VCLVFHTKWIIGDTKEGTIPGINNDFHHPWTVTRNPFAHILSECVKGALHYVLAPILCAHKRYAFVLEPILCAHKVSPFTHAAFPFTHKEFPSIHARTPSTLVEYPIVDAGYNLTF